MKHNSDLLDAVHKLLRVISRTKETITLLFVSAFSLALFFDSGASTQSWVKNLETWHVWTHVIFYLIVPFPVAIAIIRQRNQVYLLYRTIVSHAFGSTR